MALPKWTDERTQQLVDFVGQSATFNITNDGTNFGVVVTAAGTDYHVGQTYTVAGNLIGGSTPANDCTITIDSVNGTTGAIGKRISNSGIFTLL